MVEYAGREAVAVVLLAGPLVPVDVCLPADRELSLPLAARRQVQGLGLPDLLHVVAGPELPGLVQVDVVAEVELVQGEGAPAEQGVQLAAEPRGRRPGRVVGVAVAGAVGVQVVEGLLPGGRVEGPGQVAGAVRGRQLARAVGGAVAPVTWSVQRIGSFNIYLPLFPHQ